MGVWIVETVRGVLYRVVLPRSGASLGPTRRWLLAGTRVSTLVTGICLTLGMYRHWYIWIPVAVTVSLLSLDLPLAYSQKREATPPKQAS